MKLIIVLASLVLSGCASAPPFLAAMYNSADRCQNYSNQANWQQPSYCGAASGPVYVTRDYQTLKPLTITTRRGDGKNYTIPVNP